MKKKPIAGAYIDKGYIMIRLPIKNIPIAVEGAVSMGLIESPFKITDAKAFAKDVVFALNHEDEQGTTPVHELFDAAFEAAVNDGAEGWEAVGKDE